MYSTFHQHSDYINVPIRLVKPIRRDKTDWDMLVLAICLKLKSTSSGMYVHTPYDLMKSFHCSYRKAERMINKAAHHELFHYNPKTHFLSAKSFKIGADWFEDRRGNKMYHDSVVIIEKEADGTISHYRISRQLRDKLMLRQLSAKSSSDELLRQTNLRPEARKPLTHKYLSNIAGVSRSTVTRHLNKLSKGDDRVLDVTTYDKIPVCDMEHGVLYNFFPHRKPFVCGRVAYIRDANEYSFVDGNHYKQFKHIIYNHKGRRTENRVIKHHWDS